MVDGLLPQELQAGCSHCSSQDSVTRLGAWGILCSPLHPIPSLPRGLPLASSVFKTLQMPGVRWFGTKREEDVTASRSHLCSYLLLLPQWPAEQSAFFMSPNGVIQICKASVPALGSPKVFPNQVISPSTEVIVLMQ